MTQLPLRGQFLDHDMTFDASSKLAQPTDPQDARNFRTPMLIIHGGNDYRVDPSQGLSMFQVLQARFRGASRALNWRRDAVLATAWPRTADAARRGFRAEQGS